MGTLLVIAWRNLWRGWRRSAIVLLAIGVILSAGYMLWMVQRTFFGEATDELKHHMPDLNGRELAAALPLLILMVWMGVYTKTFLPYISAANTRILEQSKSGVEFRVELREGANGR